jgi:hypothetical protein
MKLERLLPKKEIEGRRKIKEESLLSGKRENPPTTRWPSLRLK